jgi:hypothetical protein
MKNRYYFFQALLIVSFLQACGSSSNSKGGYQPIPPACPQSQSTSPTISFNTNMPTAAGESVIVTLHFYADDTVTFASDNTTTLSIDGELLKYDVVNNGLAFKMPLLDRAGIHKFIYSQQVLCQTINVETDIQNKIVYEDVEYWMGNKDLPGTLLVIDRDFGVDQTRFYQPTASILKLFLAEPLIKTYANYWNIAIINTPPAKAVLIVTDAGLQFDANTPSEVVAPLLAKVPNYTDIMIETTSELGGANGYYGKAGNFGTIGLVAMPVGATVEVWEHELGHAHARLADEYTNSKLISQIPLVDGQYPNVSTTNDYDSLPWKHWIVDKNNIPGTHLSAGLKGIGAFLGAFFESNKYFRPSNNARMNDENQPFDVVDTEAWALANYEKMGILTTVNVSQNNSERTLTIARVWDSTVTRVDWYINDIKQEQLSNQSSITINESNMTSNQYTVMVTLTDLTGYIRNPDAYAAFNSEPDRNTNFQKSWTFYH